MTDISNITVGLVSLLAFIWVLVPVLWTFSKNDEKKEQRILNLENEVAEIKKLNLEVTLAEIKFQLKHIVTILELYPPAQPPSRRTKTTP